jgi:hypothetical protein
MPHSKVTDLEIEDCAETKGGVGRDDGEGSDILAEDLAGEEREGIAGQADLLLGMAQLDLSHNLLAGQELVIQNFAV